MVVHGHSLSDRRGQFSRRRKNLRVSQTLTNQSSIPVEFFSRLIALALTQPRTAAIYGSLPGRWGELRSIVRKNMSRGLLASAARHAGVGTSLFALFVNMFAPGPLAAQTKASTTTTTPIQHVIVIVGENRTFDHLFATYQPPAGQTVSNLLSKGIVNVDGTPGP